MLSINKAKDGRWAVVNGQTGALQTLFVKRQGAVRYCKKRQWDAYHEEISR